MPAAVGFAFTATAVAWRVVGRSNYALKISQVLVVRDENAPRFEENISYRHPLLILCTLGSCTYMYVYESVTLQPVNATLMLPSSSGAGSYYRTQIVWLLTIRRSLILFAEGRIVTPVKKP